MRKRGERERMPSSCRWVKGNLGILLAKREKMDKVNKKRKKGTVVGKRN